METVDYMDPEQRKEQELQNSLGVITILLNGPLDSWASPGVFRVCVAGRRMTISDNF